MFPTFISILDIQSWWEVPSIAHFCSLFRTAFNLLDFDIEDLEEALLTDGTEESSWLQELIVRLLSGCLPSNEISTFNYQMFLRRLFRQKCQEHDRYNPFNTDIDFQLLPLRTKVDILHALCDFRLDADDVLDQLKNLEADSLRVEPLGYDGNDSAYWYFYGTRLYREDFKTKNNKKKSVWQVICFTEDDWFQLTRKFKKSTCKVERQLYQTLNENFLPELPRLFKEKESLARKRLLENQPRRTSNRLRKLESESVQVEKDRQKEDNLLKEQQIRVDQEETRKRRQKAYERRAKLKEQSEEDSLSEVSVDRHDMAGTKSKRSKERQRKNSCNSSSSKEYESSKSSKRSKKNVTPPSESSSKSLSSSKPTTVGRQTNNSLSAATGQILIQPLTNPTKKKLKTSQIFRQTDEDLQTGMHKILDFVKNHEDAWPFADPVEEEYAPNYYTVIRKPMDLQRMEERLDSGYYKTFSKFRSDFQLIVDNCRLYNGAENEYTEMVGNLEKVFERATEKYLDQISSSDDEIAVEFLNADMVDAKAKPEEPSPYKRKPMLAAQTDKKRERSDSEDSLSERSNSFEKVAKSKRVDKVTKKQSKGKREKEVKKDKSEKESRKEKSEKESRKEKSGKELKRNKSEGTKDKSEMKKEKDVKKTKEKKSKSKKATKKEKRKTVAKSRHMSRSPSRSLRSDMSSPPPSWPPSSPDSRFDFIPKKRQLQEMCDSDESLSQGKYKKSGLFDDFATEASKDRHVDKKIKIDYISPPLSPKPKDKHNKLRETIEKLKAKSELKLKDEFDFEVDHLKENKDKNKNIEKEEKFRPKIKEKPAKLKKEPLEPDLDCSSTMDSERSENRKSKKMVPPQINAALPPAVKNPSNLEALSIATEQTLKDINKWLDDTPKFSEFSSASNSPSYTGLDEFDVLSGAKIEQMPGRKVERPSGGGGAAVKKEGLKDGKKRPFRDPAKFFKRREVQRTIERLQPGKSKGNLIANVQNTNKVEEIFPLGPLSKIKDTKNSLIVKTDTNAPKLSLGSVLDSFGKHKFVDDQKKEEQVHMQVLKEENQQSLLKETVNRENKSVEEVKEVVEKKEDKVEKEPNAADDAGVGGATPNLSAWFKAFGAPKMPAPQKKTDIKPDGKENEKTDEMVANKNTESRKVALPTASPNTDSPLQHGQPTPRQRKISTGSSMSERSSFSQDMDSPRVGFDERGAYPAPYPSPMHRSPSGASPVMASPRPDISPKATAYPTINGQIRVGFYQDTVSNKSSPDKSCSPRENPQSPYPHYSEHVYTPTTTESSFYSYAANSPYYSHAPNYSSTNPTPPYNTEASNSSYYDTSKSLTDQYQAKSAQKYAANSPLSDSSSPARRQARQSPGENTPTSPGTGGMNSPHSPGVYSQHSPIVLPQHSPSVSAQQSPSVNSQASPNVHAQHSPAVQIEHSPKPSPDVPSESQDDELLSANEDSKAQQGASFPVKKRTYSDDLPQISIQRYEIDSRLSQRERISQSNQVIELDASPEPSPPCSEKLDSDCLTIENVSDLKSTSMKESSCVETPATKQQSDFAAAAASSTFSAAFGADSSYPLNIPTAGSLTPSQSAKLDMSKYTNMGYTGPEVNLTRSLSLQHYNKPELSSTRTTVSQKYTAQQSLTVAASQYGNPNSALQQMGYKSMEMTNPQQAHSNFGTARTSENVAGRLSQAQDIPSGYKPEVTIPRPSYNNPAIPNHIVDRFSNEERMMAGLQSTTSFYTDKGLGTSHMFNKAISTSASALPMFSQANIAAMQTFTQNVQGTTSSMYNRQMSELQNPGLMQAEEKTSQPAPEKKVKKRKSKASASAAPTESQLANAANQGFQSYAGLKSNSSMEPGAISLKTSSVVPGSAFNFGPTPAGLGIGTSLYGDKDAFPNFLEEFRSAPNYYMAAAAAVHHRSTPEAADKQAGRAAHQSSNAQAAASYPFLGAPQARSTYPIGGPFIPNAQAQLMDSSSPLYQQYFQAGLLNQGLLGPPGAYPPGYHAALSMRQPYDSMTRPSWL